MDCARRSWQWRAAIEPLLYIAVWYGASVLYSVNMQQFLSAVNEQGAPALSATWLVVATCIGLLTLQAACCTLLDGSVWLLHSMCRSDDRNRRYARLAQTEDRLGHSNNKLQEEHEEADQTENGVGENGAVKSGRAMSASRPWFTFRAVLLTVFSGMAAFLQTAALQLSGITCFNIVRVFEPCMAATYAAVWRGASFGWMSGIGLSLVAVACFLGVADAQSCSFLSANQRVMTAMLLALVINCCMIGRNSVVQLLPKDDNSSKYRSNRLQESVTYYCQLLLIMLLLVLPITVLSPPTRALYRSLFVEQPQLVRWALSSSAMYAVYNHCSLLVCERVDLVTHSVLTIFKRPLLILASTLYLQGYVGWKQPLVCALISIGMLLHMRAQHNKGRDSNKDSRAAGQVEPANGRLATGLSLLTVGAVVGYVAGSALPAVQQAMAGGGSSLVLPLTVGGYTSTCRASPRNSTGTNWDSAQCGLPLYHWHATAWGQSGQNFGDELSGVLLRLLTNGHMRLHAGEASARLLAVGSIVDLSAPGDVLWSTGVKQAPNGEGERTKLASLLQGSTITAMRGPRSRAIIHQVTGEQDRVPPVYGDGALLLPLFFPHLVRHSIESSPQLQVLVLPHYHEHAHTVDTLAAFTNHSRLRDPYSLKLASIMDPWPLLLRAITSADLVVTSSLHGVIVAEAFGVPARYWRTPASKEPLHKYHDYYEGTDRVGDMPYATSLPAALTMGGQPPIPDLAAIQNRLLHAFPVHLWDGCQPKFEFCFPTPPPSWPSSSPSSRPAA